MSDLTAFVLLSSPDDRLERALADVVARTVHVASPRELAQALTRADDVAALVVSDCITTSECVDLLAACAAARPTLPLGFLVARPAGQLVERIARLPRSGAMVVAEEHPRALAFLDEPFGARHPAKLDASRAGPEVAAALAQEPLSLLVLGGHSNGVCQGAATIALCQRDARRIPTPAPLAAGRLPCFVGAPCRFPAERYKRVATDSLRARVVLSLTCFGQLLGDHVLQAVDGVGAGLLRNPEVQAVLSTFTPLVVDRHDYLTATYLTLSGTPIGRVASALNRARLRGHDALAPEFACLGDPRTRLASTVHETDALVENERILVRRPRGVTGACDVHARVDEVLDGEVLLVDGAAGVRCGVVLSSGDLFVTLEPDVEQATLLRHDVAALRESLSLDSLLPSLLRLDVHLRSLGSLARHRCSPETVQDYSDDLAHAQEIARRCLDLVQRHQPSELREGAVLHLEELRATFVELGLVMADLQTAVTGALRAHLGRGGLFDPMRPYLSARTLRRTGEDCPHCGAPVREQTFEASGGAFALHIGACDLCGKLYEGSGVARRVESAPRVTPGDTLDLHVGVENPYPFDVRVSGLALFQPFESTKERVAVPVAAFALGGGARGTVQARVHVPHDTPFGVHRVNVVVLLASRVEHVIRYVVVDPSHSARTEEGAPT